MNLLLYDTSADETLPPGASALTADDGATVLTADDGATLLVFEE